MTIWPVVIAKPSLQCPGLAFVHLVVGDFDPRVLRSQIIGDRTRPVRGAIVDDHNFAGFRNRQQTPYDFGQRGFFVGLPVSWR